MKICCRHDLRMNALKVKKYKKYKNLFFGFFSCENGFWYYLRVRARKSYSEKFH